MAQARKKRPSKAAAWKRPSFTLTGHGIGMLLCGVVIGSIGTVLWQGYQSRDSEVGSGIRQMIESSRQNAEQVVESDIAPAVKPEPQTTNYDFFTVLPEIEVVVSSGEPEPAAPVPPKPALSDNDDQPGSDAPVTELAVQKPVQSSAYMLQAGSYNQRADAERQKANLALAGLQSTIQKVTIQGRGDFYRVRLGPFVDQARMLDADRRLQQAGIKAMRLKVSRGQQG